MFHFLFIMKIAWRVENNPGEAKVHHEGYFLSVKTTFLKISSQLEIRETDLRDTIYRLNANKQYLRWNITQHT